MSNNRFDEQRRQQLEERLALQYDKLHKFKNKLITCDSFEQKYSIQHSIEHEIIPSLRSDEKEYAELLVETVPDEGISEAEAEQLVGELQDASRKTQAHSAGDNLEIMRILEEIQQKLNQPGKSAVAKLKVTLPIIPGLAAYQLEADSENFIGGVWRKIRDKFKRAADPKNPMETRHQ
jgi:hypothetical protein